MTFNNDNFGTIGGESVVAPSVYSYSSDDSLATVLAADYFYSKRFVLETGDWVLAFLSDGHYHLNMSSGSTAISGQFFDKMVVVKEAADISGSLDSTVVYFIDGIIDMGGRLQL